MIHCSPSANTQALITAARQILPKSVGVAVCNIQTQTQGILPAAATNMASMIPSRRREFTAGRLAARNAMAEIGHFDHPVPMGADRAPIWPTGLVGSISHNADCAIALAAADSNFCALGVDLEPDTPLDPTLLDEVLSGAELQSLQNHKTAIQGQLARLIFSAKECAYKCQYPLTRQLFGFGGFEIHLDLNYRSFKACFTQAIGNFTKNQILSGRFHIGDGVILTTMALTANGSYHTEE